MTFTTIEEVKVNIVNLNFELVKCNGRKILEKGGTVEVASFMYPRKGKLLSVQKKDNFCDQVNDKGFCILAGEADETVLWRNAICPFKARRPQDYS